MTIKSYLSKCVALAVLCVSSFNVNASNSVSVDDPASLVYQHLDSENSRWFFFTSACRPFGMVNLSPDTQINGSWGSGYRYNTDTVKGFSHVHAWQLSALSVMPVTYENEAAKKELYTNFSSHFSHEAEKLSPGYHRVFLDRFNVDAELTSTKRVGFHKYQYSTSAKKAVLLNLNTPLGPSDNTNGYIFKLDGKTLSGEVTSLATPRRPKQVRIYFQLAFDNEIAAIEKDEETGNYLVMFDDATKEILMKAAISYTSAENAKVNMQTELPGWDFAATVKDSHDEWNSMLSKIKIKTDDDKAARRFYTDLWHALQGRRVISDANGAYPDNTGSVFRIGQIPLDKDGKPMFNHYNSDAFWGAQWTITTLWQLVYPDIAEEFINSMMLMYKDGGMIPRGPSGGNYTFVMTGASSTPFIVAAYQKGIRGYDKDLLYEGLRKNHLPGGIMERAGYEHYTTAGGGLKYYIEKGYVPFPNPDKDANGMHRAGAAQTLEYSYQDWTLAQYALALGHDDDYKMFMKRSQNYKNIYDASTGWMRPKNVDGKWYEPFDPYALAIGFVEANAAQDTWFVPHDLKGLSELMGGNKVAIKKLNQQFEEAAKLDFTSGGSHAHENLDKYRRIPINYGNQPSIQTAFVFNHLGAPSLTQYWSREVVEKVFSGIGTNTGYCGDEDQGLMSSLSVLYKIGLFQMNGGTDIEPYYELGSPIFDRVEIDLDPNYYKGGKFVINIENNSSDNRYIKSATINGEKVKGYTIPHKTVVGGGELDLVMKSK